MIETQMKAIWSFLCREPLVHFIALAGLLFLINGLLAGGAREVIRIDRARKVVMVQNLDTGTIEEESYDRLILSPGSSPVIPPLPGVNLPFVFTFKTLEDMDLVYQYLQERHPVRRSS